MQIAGSHSQRLVNSLDQRICIDTNKLLYFTGTALWFILIWDWLLRALTGAGWGYEQLVIWFVRWVYFHLSWNPNHMLWLLYLKAHEGNPTGFHVFCYETNFQLQPHPSEAILWLWMLLWFFLVGGLCAGFSGFSSCGIQAEFPWGMWNIKVSWQGIKTHTHCTGRQILYPWTIREVPNVVMTFKFVLNVAQVPCCLSGLLHLFWAS